MKRSKEAEALALANRVFSWCSICAYWCGCYRANGDGPDWMDPSCAKGPAIESPADEL